MRKKIIIIAGIAIGILLSIALGRLISDFSTITRDYFVPGTGRLLEFKVRDDTVDYYVPGTGRVLEFKVRDENGITLSSVAIDVELKEKIDEETYSQYPDELKEKWKDKTHRLLSIKNVQYHPDDTISVAFAPLVGENQRTEPDSIILHLYRMGNKKRKREFTLEELNGNYHVGTRDNVKLSDKYWWLKQDHVKVYHIPDFVLEEEGEW